MGTENKAELMEKLLLKLARQLDSLDEASLMSLWSKYATLTSRFEPTKRWEDACLVFSLIQAKRWKNQLFNYSWSQQKMPPLREAAPDQAGSAPHKFNLEEKGEAEPEQMACRVLAFRPSSHTAEDEQEPDKE